MKMALVKEYHQVEMKLIKIILHPKIALTIRKQTKTSVVNLSNKKNVR